MSYPPSSPEREGAYSDKENEPEEDLNLNDTEHEDQYDEEIDDADKRDELRKLREEKHPKLPPLRTATMKGEEVIKRRTGGILTNLNINQSDRERENLHSVAKIRDNSYIKEANFRALRQNPKRIRMFKESLVTGKFIEVNKEPEQYKEEEELYPIDAEDILEYQLFNSIDTWSRRVINYLNLCSGVLVGMFVVQLMVVLALSDTESYKISLYYSQIFTLFVNLCVIFSVAETLLTYDKYSRLSTHHHRDTVKFQGFFLLSLVLSIIFMVCWALVILLPFPVLTMAYQNVNDISNSDLALYQAVTLIVGGIFTLYFVTSPFLKRDDYVYDSYEMLYSDDDIYAVHPDAVEMTAFA